jgi:uncharacterized iron-regulated protein
MMKTPVSAKTLCTWSLGLLCLWILPACHPLSVATPTLTLVPSQTEIIKALTQAKVVYLAEIHDRPADHQAQLEIITKLYKHNPNLVVALEMFQRPFQPVLDQYLAGEISETDLITQTEYEQRWGYDWEMYAPILRFSQNHNLPLLALNTPTEVTRQVAKEGLASLTPAQQEYIPPLSEIDLDDPAYRQRIQEIYAKHAGHGDSDSFERFFAAQVLWDETMADAIATYLQANPNAQIVVLAGRGHVIYGQGIPSRVARRIDSPNFTQASVLFASEDPEAFEEGMIDYVWETNTINPESNHSE